MQIFMVYDFTYIMSCIQYLSILEEKAGLLVVFVYG